MYKCRIYALLPVKSDIIRKFSLSFLKKLFIFSLFSRFPSSYPGFFTSTSFVNLHNSFYFFLFSFYICIYCTICRLVGFLYILRKMHIYAENRTEKHIFRPEKCPERGFLALWKSTLFVEKCRKILKVPVKGHFQRTGKVPFNVHLPGQGSCASWRHSKRENGPSGLVGCTCWLFGAAGVILHLAGLNAHSGGLTADFIRSLNWIAFQPYQF